jgi:hypothetical protein
VELYREAGGRALPGADERPRRANRDGLQAIELLGSEVARVVRAEVERRAGVA